MSLDIFDWTMYIRIKISNCLFLYFSSSRSCCIILIIFATSSCISCLVKQVCERPLHSLLLRQLICVFLLPFLCNFLSICEDFVPICVNFVPIRVYFVSICWSAQLYCVNLPPWQPVIKNKGVITQMSHLWHLQNPFTRKISISTKIIILIKTIVRRSLPLSKLGRALLYLFNILNIFGSCNWRRRYLLSSIVHIVDPIQPQVFAIAISHLLKLGQPMRLCLCNCLCLCHCLCLCLFHWHCNITFVETWAAHETSHHLEQLALEHLTLLLQGLLTKITIETQQWSIFQFLLIFTHFWERFWVIFTDFLKDF